MSGDPCAQPNEAFRSCHDATDYVSAEIWLGSPAAARRFAIDELSPVERARYDALKGELRRREFAASRALRHAAVSSSGNASRPSSLSHSGGWAAVARADEGCRVGVDLEFHRARNLLGIARFAFDPAEIAMLEAWPAEQLPAAFFTLWTLKESMAKALGLPLLVASRECVFTAESPADIQEGTGWHWTGKVPSEEPWLARVFRPRADMALCVAVIGSDDVDSLSTREWPDERQSEWEPAVTIRSGERG